MYSAYIYIYIYVREYSIYIYICIKYTAESVLTPVLYLQQSLKKSNEK